jgi:hypothetical protein
VQLASDKQPKVDKRMLGLAQIHVSFVSKQTSFLVTEKVLREIFKQFGTIADVTIKQHNLIEV